MLDLLCVYFMAQLAESSLAHLGALLLKARGGGRGDLDHVCLDIQLVMLACLKASWLNRGCVVSHE